MKKIFTIAILILGSQVAAADVFNGTELDLLPSLLGDPKYYPVEEEPGHDAEVIDKVIHSKVVSVDSKSIRFKWTSLGYGAVTHKVIVPELANHTVFDHRNKGEEGPCLRSFLDFGEEQKEIHPDNFIEVHIQIKNQYRVNREKKICKVTMIEDVKTVVDGVEFVHTYSKPMGYRFIGDCIDL